MALQTRSLSMVALSISRDRPPNRLQPRLPDGIHLRWSFEPSRGFPWYGYYLFRRSTTTVDRKRRDLGLVGLTLGSIGSALLRTPNGEISGDNDLVLTDDFAPSGQLEIDLSGQHGLRYVPAALARVVEVEIGFRQDTTVVLAARLEQVPVHIVAVSGRAGQIVHAELESDAISQVEISGGPAAIVSIGFVEATGSPLVGWQALPGFPYINWAAPAPYAMCLPVAHPDYPCPGAPTTAVAAEQLALSRVKYARPGIWAGTSFRDLHTQLRELVDGGRSGRPMCEKRATTSPAPPEPGLTMPSQSPLDLVLLGALHPAIAQMLGLYWVDESVTSTPTVGYDYLIVADYDGRLRGTPQDILQFLRTNGFGGVDAFIVYDKRLSDPTPPLEPPRGVRAYALPGAGKAKSGGGIDGNGVGLVWDRGIVHGTLPPGRAILYHVWRADLGAGSSPASPTTYVHLTKHGPVLIADRVSSSRVQTPEDWPPFRLCYTDSGLADGWYGYQVSGIDIFGRHSANSDAAPWHQWVPAPSPLPWYYNPPPSDTAVHPWAVAVLDKTAPPPPTGIEAYALDEDDPLLVQDAAYSAWRASLPANEKRLVGLRVSWLWPQSQMDQAPDTREFRIYCYRGRQNTFIGSATTVAEATAAESFVDTDIPNTHTADAYVGARLQIGNASFRVLGSDAATPLRLRVANIGAKNEVRPASISPCSVVIPATVGSGSALRPHPLFVDYSVATNWEERFSVVSYNDHVAEDLMVSTAGGSELSGSGATAAGTEVTLGGTPNIGGAGIVGSYLQLDKDAARPDKLYRILAVDPAAGKATLDATPALATTPSDWRIVRKLRRYEVFFPIAGDAYRGGAPVTATSTEPLAYGSIGVSAVDDKQHSTDAAKWALGRWGGPSRYGNEGRVSAPAVIYMVDRSKPPAPALPTYPEDRLFATRADYHGLSFFTFRWVKPSGAKTHILRALDDTLFKADWLIRTTRTALAATTESHEVLFPPAWEPARRQAASTQLNGISAETHYAGLSNDARALLTRLPGNEGFEWDGGLQDRDWEIRRSRQSLSADDAAFFPREWNSADAATVQKRKDVACALTGIKSPADYGALSNNALRVLASLPGNEAAFTQLTIEAVDPDDPAAADHRGPDDLDDKYTAQATLRAYQDTLDGRASNRYFYRALNVNAVHTRGDLSLSSPPVCCPDVVRPRAPVVTKVSYADAELSLTWASNREGDLAEYRVYRVSSEAAAHDIRLMQQVAKVAETQTDARLRSAEVSWTDKAVIGGLRYYYRLVAADQIGNVSDPCGIVATRALDTRSPIAPVWEEITWVLLRTATGEEEPWPMNGVIPLGRQQAMRLVWSSSVSAGRFVLTRQCRNDTGWQPIDLSGGVEELAQGKFRFYDAAVLPQNVYRYRIGVVSAGGVASLEMRDIEIGRP